METDRAAVERDLTRLLNRALRSVPYVRLDKIEEVMELFQHAIDQMDVDIESVESHPEDDKARSDAVAIADKLKTLPTDGPAGYVETEEEKAANVARPLSLAAKLNVTRDYSSPTMGGRRLGGDSPVPTKQQAARAEASRPLGLGLKGKGAIKPSSRAAATSSHAVTAAAKPMHKNPLLAKALDVHGAGPSKESRVPTQDYSSPRLAGRRLGGDDDERKEQPEQGPKSQPQPAAEEHKEEEEETEEEETEEEDHAEVPKNRLAARPLTGATASPTQVRSSLVLLNLANNRDATGSPMMAPKSLIPAAGTPKPAFLRRLDSPDSHHGQLLSAKAKLTRMLTLALQAVPRISLANALEVRKSLTKACTVLESSTVHP